MKNIQKYLFFAFLLLFCLLNGKLLSDQNKYELPSSDSISYRYFTGISLPSKTEREALESARINATTEAARTIEVIIYSETITHYQEIGEKYSDFIKKFTRMATFPTTLSLEFVKIIEKSIDSQNNYKITAEYRTSEKDYEEAKRKRKETVENIQNEIREKYEEYNKYDYNDNKKISILSNILKIIRDNYIFYPPYTEKFINDQLKKISLLAWFENIKIKESEDISIFRNDNIVSCKISCKYRKKELFIFAITSDNSTYQLNPPINNLQESNTIDFYKDNKNIGLIFILSKKNEGISDFCETNIKTSGIKVKYWTKDNANYFLKWYDENKYYFESVKTYYIESDISSQTIILKTQFDPKPIKCDGTIEAQKIRLFHKRDSERIQNKINEMKSGEILCFKKGCYYIDKPIIISKKSVSFISKKYYIDFIAVDELNDNEAFIKIEDVDNDIFLSHIRFNFKHKFMNILSIKNINSPVDIKDCKFYSYIKPDNALIEVENCDDIIVENCYYIHLNYKNEIIGEYSIIRKDDSNFYVGNKIENNK